MDWNLQERKVPKGSTYCVPGPCGAQPGDGDWHLSKCVRICKLMGLCSEGRRL